MEDDDDYSFENTYLRHLYDRLTTEAIVSMNDDDDEDYYYDDDNYSSERGSSYIDSDIGEIDDEDDIYLDEDDDMEGDDALSEASTVQNEDMPEEVDQSGTDTEVELDNAVEEENIVQSQKKIKLDVPQEEVAHDIANDTLDDDQKCPICLETWSNAGEHRLCSLRCGHLFGLKCITQWFNVAQSAAGRKCPECNTKASKKDIRVLYAKKLMCIDTIEIEKLKEQLKNACSRRDHAESELKLCQTKELLYQKEITNLRLKIEELEKEVKSATTERNNFSVQYKNIILKKNKIFDICNNNSCRVMAYNPWHKILVTSSNSAINRIFIETLSTSLNFKLHNGVIRDLAFQEQHPNILLSVAFDKKIMLTDIRNNVLIHNYQEETNLWSCCWSNYSTQTFFVGGARGDVNEYDIRYLQSSVSKRENVADRSPVVSLASVPTSSSALRAGGYLACHLNSCYAYGFKEGNYVGNKIDFEGPFTSLKYNEKDNHVLLSCRANPKNPAVRHVICSIEKNEDQIKFNAVHTFTAGSAQKLLSRPCYMNLQNDSMVVAYNENINSITAWSMATGKQAYSIPISEPVVDVCTFETDAIFQAVLTSNKLHIYRNSEMSA